METTLSEQCKCGGAIAVPFFAPALIHSFVERHKHCITQVSNDDIEEPGGDVYTSSERAGQHSQHELQIGFQREEQW
jgi:hypothetical protein